MSKTLIIHHLEPMWETGYNRFGQSFDKLQELVAEHIEDNEYSKVILTRFEDNSIDYAEYYRLGEHIDRVHEYAYGWCAESMADEDEETGEPEDVMAIIDEKGEYKDRFFNTVCRGGNHSEVVLIAQWMRDLPKDGSVDICGAFDGECVEDLEIALGHLDIGFNRIESLIV